MTSSIAQDPDPTRPGERVKFTFNIDGISLPVTLTGTWDPGNQSFTHTIASASDATWEEDVPGDASGGVIVDESGQTSDFAIAVSP